MRKWTRRLACWLVDRYAQVYMVFNRITPVDSSRINEAVWAVKAGQVNFYLYRKNGRVVCIDTGFAPPVVERELAKLGVDAGEVTHVFLTHTDFDHAGGVGVFAGAAVHLSRDEEAMIDGSRSRRLGLIYNRLRCAEYELLDDGAVVRVGDIKVRAVAAPGHTPGSMAYLLDDAYLFTGDAFRIIDGRALPIRRILTMDRAAELRSIRRLANLPGVRMVLTGHRGVAENFYEIMEAYTEKDQR